MAIKTTIHSLNLVFTPSTRAPQGQTKRIGHVTYPKVANSCTVPVFSGSRRAGCSLTYSHTPVKRKKNAKRF